MITAIIGYEQCLLDRMQANRDGGPDASIREGLVAEMTSRDGNIGQLICRLQDCDVCARVVDNGPGRGVVPIDTRGECAARKARNASYGG